MKYKVVTGETYEKLNEVNENLARVVWPELMLHDAVANKYFGELYNLFPEYQFAMLEVDSEKVMSIGNSIPFYCNDDIDNLPDEGWDWVLQKGIADFKNGITPNILSAIQVMVSPDFKSKGLSGEAVKVMKEIAKKAGFKNLIAPVRPNMKPNYPLTSIDNYIKWKTDEGLPFDAWLRVHARIGAKIIKPCHKAMLIQGSIDDWQEWTKMKFPESGEYVIPGALNPVDMNLENDLGTYIEPNVWMNHIIK